MRKELGTNEIVQITSSFVGKKVNNIIFDMDTELRGASQRDMEEVPVFKGLFVGFEDGTNAEINEQGVKNMIVGYFSGDGQIVNPDEDIHFNMSMHHTGQTPMTRSSMPKFKGISVDYQELELDMDRPFRSLARYAVMNVTGP